MNTEKEIVGFIGQGWIGRNYANDFEARGYSTVRYGLEDKYKGNKNKIKDCPVTIIAVPTPTTPDGFCDKALRSALSIIGKGNVAVIKSTTSPGKSATLQEDFADIIVLHSPEFLVEKTAAYDAANPSRNLVGLTANSEEHKVAANKVLSMLPKAPYQAVMTSMESEIVKYAGNCFLYTKVLFMNLLHDISVESDSDFEVIKEALVNDLRIGRSHTEPVNDGGRGAGGHCFIKDFEAFRGYHSELFGDNVATELLACMVNYNNHLLKSSGKNLDLLKDVYGSEILNDGHKVK